MASKSTFYGGTNFIRNCDKNISELIEAEVKERMTGVQNSLLSLTQRVDFLNTNFEKYKGSTSTSIKRDLQESKEEILKKLSSLAEKIVNQVQTSKETRKKRRKVPRELAVS